MNKKKVARDDIVRTLVSALKPLDYVHALYESGAIVFKRADEWSDIDLYIIVDDEKVEEAFVVVEEALKSLSPIKQKFVVPQLPWPSVSQAFYRLEQASEYLLLDLAVIKLSGPEKFLEPQIHGKAVFYFNKSKKVRVPTINKKDLAKKLQQKLTGLKDRFAMFNISVQKEINRGNHLEALVLYHSITLGSIVDLLRIKYSPFHHDFKTHYVRYDLPKKIVDRLERLFFVEDGKDLLKKYCEATKWFNEIIAE